MACSLFFSFIYVATQGLYPAVRVKCAAVSVNFKHYYMILHDFKYYVINSRESDDVSATFNDVLATFDDVFATSDDVFAK